MSTELLSTLEEYDMIRLSETGAMCIVMGSTLRQDGVLVVYVSEVFSPDEHVLIDDSEIREGSIYKGTKMEDLEE